MRDEDRSFLLALAFLMVFTGIVIAVGLVLFDRWVP